MNEERKQTIVVIRNMDTQKISVSDLSIEEVKTHYEADGYVVFSGIGLWRGAFRGYIMAKQADGIFGEARIRIQEVILENIKTARIKK